MDGCALTSAKGGPKLVRSAGSSEAAVIYAGGLRAANISMETFAGMLRSPAGRPVVDKTGIAGEYDFTLRYAPEGDAEASLPSLFTALEEQCGLKLEGAKVPVETITIDRVEKVPAEN